MKKDRIMLVAVLFSALAIHNANPQTSSQPAASASRAVLPALPAPMGIPKPGPVTDAPYAPQPILQGGVVVPLYPPDSPLLHLDRIREAEQYTMSESSPGRINYVVNVHNPSIEVHTVETNHGMNTGAAIILASGGGHTQLSISYESADLVPFFHNYGINTVILRYRLRRDGYNPQVDAVHDAEQAIRLVRAHAREWNLDPRKIGIMGFSAGAELATPAAVLYDDFDQKNSDPADPLAGISSRPDFVGVIYPGPSPFARNRTPPPIPKNVPPSFIVGAGAGDQNHAVWANDYFLAMLTAGIPNIEMHIYAQGAHPGTQMGNGISMSGGLTDRDGTPYGTWQYRFVDWFRDLGFMQKPGVETKAARDIVAFINQPPGGRGRGPGGGSGRGGRGGSGAAGAAGGITPR